MNNTFEYSLFDAIAALLKRKWSLAIWVIATMFVVGVVTLIVPKSYKSEGKIFVRLGRENASLDATTTMGDHPVVAVPLTRESEINSVTEMIKNRSLYERVVDRIGADVILKKAPFVAEEDDSESTVSDSGYTSGFDPLSIVIDPVMGLLTAIGAVNDLSLHERAVIRLGKDLDVEPLEKSNVVQVGFESHDPRLAQEVVRLLIQFYEESHTRVHRSTGSFAFLEQQTERIRKELEESENNFESFKNSTGILEIEQQRQVVIGRISEITDKKLANEARLAGIENEIENLIATLNSMSDTIVIQSTTGPGQEGVDGMREEFFKLEMEISELRARYSEDHPIVLRKSKQLAAMQAVIDDEEQNRGEQVQGVNEVFGKTKITLIAKEAEKVAVKREISEYESQLNELNGNLDAFNADEKTFLRLQRDFIIKDASYRKYSNNLEQARIDHLLQSSNLSNISIAQPATLSFKPSKPNKLLNLILGFVFGAMLGTGRILWSDYNERFQSQPTGSLNTALESNAPEDEDYYNQFAEDVPSNNGASGDQQDRDQRDREHSRETV